MFEDEADSLTWIRKHVGIPREIDWQESSKGPSAIIVTDEGVVASMDLRAHRIKWRAVLPESKWLALVLVACRRRSKRP